MLQEKLKNAFIENDGLLSIKQAESLGFSREGLRKAYKRGDLDKVRSGIYTLPNTIPDHQVVLQIAYSRGVFSHESAAALYGLTSMTPFKAYMTFPHGYHSSELEKELVKPIYASGNYYEMGQIKRVNWLGNEILVYNKEKTVIDLIRSNHTLPLIRDEVIKNYLMDDEADIEQLKSYATSLGVLDQVERYVFNHGKFTESKKLSTRKVTRI